MTFNSTLPAHLLLDLDISVTDRIEQVSIAIAESQTLKLERDWNKLVQHASKLGGLAEVTLHQISARSIVGGLARDRLASRDHGFRAFYAAIKDSDSAETADILQQLRSKFTEELDDPIKVQEKLDELLNGESAMFNSVKPFSKLFNDHEEMFIDFFAQLRALMLNAEFVGLFQKSGSRILSYSEELKSNIAELTGIPLLQDDTDVLTEQINRMRNSVEEGYSQIFSALSDEVSVKDFAGVALTVYADTASLSGLIGRLLGGYLTLAQLAENPEDRVLQLQKALEATEWQSRISLLHVYTAYIAANIQSRDINRWYSHEKDRVSARELTSEVPQGIIVSVEQITQDAGLNVGEMFQLEGIVANLRIEDDPGPPKFSSFFELTNPISGMAVKVRAHMFSLLNNGVSEGAYCRLNGFLRREEPWLAAGVTGIDIDRVSLTQLRKTSWTDDITHRMRSYTTLYFDGMNMFNTLKLVEKENQL